MKEIATLEKRSADERSHATRAHGDALRVRNSFSSSMSESQLRSKLRDIQRHEEKATTHEKRAAQFADQIASKRRALTSAENSLQRALEQERQREGREIKRRRDEELRHVRQLEAARRATLQPLPVTIPARPATAFYPTRATATATTLEYDVCLTFAGENRDYVQMVARGLQEAEIRVFYDDDEKITLWGKDLVEHFDRIYRKASRYCVMFISEHYARKPWARHERRSALARALVEEDEYILPARFDDTELDGLPPTISYLDLREIAPATLVEYIVKKVAVSHG